MSDADLRETLLATLRRSGALRNARVAAALGKVPRHRFMPGTSLDDAYADRAVAIKTHGETIVSSISQPGMIAQMLELLAPEPGDRVLEIGTGSGYNAALLAELVGPGGAVTTVELDAELARRAAATLEELGYANVRVVTADGSALTLDDGRYDRLEVTARAEDIADAWWNALSDGARIVVPLFLEKAGEYAVGFEKRDRRLSSLGLHPCAFIALRGEAEIPASGDVFFRDPATRQSAACLRRVADVQAVRRIDATPQLLDEADVVIARPVTVFAVSFA